MRLRGAHLGRRRPERADWGAGVVADHSGDADDVGQEFLAIHGEAVAAPATELFAQRHAVGNSVRRNPLRAIGGEYPANFVLRKPSEYRLAGGGGVGRVGAADGSGVDPDGVASVALDDLHDAEALQDREMDSLSGRDVDPIDHRLGPPGQVDPLQARLAEMDNTRAERVATPARPTRCIDLLP